MAIVRAGPNVVATALQETIRSDGDGTKEWGVRIEAAQVAQVFIVDATLRQQLEAEVRNEIKLKADQSNMQAQEQIQLAELASEGRVKELKLAADRETLRREEELEMARIDRQRREQTENLATERQALKLEQERLHARLVVDEDRVNAEAPVRLLRIETERAILAQELEMRRLQNQVTALDVESKILLPRAQQDLRREMLPLEQAPEIVESASRVFQGANLSIYGEDGQLLGHLAPLLDLLTRSVQQAVPGSPVRVAGSAEPASIGLE